MFTADEILFKVNDYINNISYNRKPWSLYEPIKYVLSLGGKRIRPILMLLSYNLFKDDPESIITPACAHETNHKYNILNDELMDDAPLRRGQQTVHVRWDANTAVLSGDSMLVLAFERMAKCNDKHLREVLKLFTTTALEIGEGQQYDMEFETRNDVKEEEYIEMIRLKTSVLLACAMKIGAILADAPQEDAENLYKFGEQVGLAFQLQDDYLDVYGDPKVFGKKIGGDITSNKKTYMLINAFNKANVRQRKELEKWITCEHFVQDEKVEAVTKLYNKIGVDKMAIDRINYYFEEANKYLAAVNVSDARKQELVTYAQRMLHRKR